MQSVVVWVCFSGEDFPAFSAFSEESPMPQRFGTAGVDVQPLAVFMLLGLFFPLLLEEHHERTVG